MMLSGALSRSWVAGLVLPLLAACALPQPAYVQTPGSRAAFALFEQVQEGARRDLLDAARTAGLVKAGVCREVGGGRLYCNALRVREADYYVALNGRLDFDLGYEELRFCLAPGRAVGFRAHGASSVISVPLYREYPEEFASMLGAAGVQVQPDPRSAERTLLFPDASMTELPVGAALRRLGYGGPGSRFEQADSGEYSAGNYPGHAEGERACQAL